MHFHNLNDAKETTPARDRRTSLTRLRFYGSILFRGIRYFDLKINTVN